MNDHIMNETDRKWVRLLTLVTLSNTGLKIRHSDKFYQARPYSIEEEIIIVSKYIRRRGLKAFVCGGYFGDKEQWSVAVDLAGDCSVLSLADAILAMIVERRADPQSGINKVVFCDPSRGKDWNINSLLARRNNRRPGCDGSL